MLATLKLYHPFEEHNCLIYVDSTLYSNHPTYQEFQQRVCNIMILHIVWFVLLWSTFTVCSMLLLHCLAASLACSSYNCNTTAIPSPCKFHGTAVQHTQLLRLSGQTWGRPRLQRRLWLDKDMLDLGLKPGDAMDCSICNAEIKGYWWDSN